MARNRPGYMAAYNADRREQGQCHDCAGPLDRDGARCVLCNERHRDRQRRYKQRLAVLDRPQSRYYAPDAEASFGQIAAELNITPAYARVIYITALRKLRLECHRHGINLEDLVNAPEHVLAGAETWGEE